MNVPAYKTTPYEQTDSYKVSWHKMQAKANRVVMKELNGFGYTPFGGCFCHQVDQCYASFSTKPVPISAWRLHYNI